VNLIPAHSQKHIPLVRDLFKEYAAWLGFDLCFQDFDRELAELPGDYAPPTGRLLLAMEGNQVAGCVALRRFEDDDTCEMKRLYVRPAFRGRGIGRTLAIAIIDEARTIGYKRMRLDTVPSMTTAMSLYEMLGFRDVEPYRHNPIEGVRFMELTLSGGEEAAS